LAAAAKELGLSMQQARQPRRQVRQRPHASRNSSTTDLFHHTAAVVQHLFLDTSLEDARMRAIYSAHAERHFLYDEDVGDDYNGLFRTSLPEFGMTTVLEEGGEGGGGEGLAVDAHGVEIGGDLVSACTGTYSIPYILQYCILFGGEGRGERDLDSETDLLCAHLLTFPLCSYSIIIHIVQELSRAWSVPPFCTCPTALPVPVTLSHSPSCLFQQHSFSTAPSACWMPGSWKVPK
jgi:hypothetical protein